MISAAETAPLLQDVSHPDGSPREPENQNFLSRISSLVHEPLTPLTQLLLVIAIFFLLLSSIFIGLFAGAQYKLDSGEGSNTTVTVTATTTAVATQTATSTTVFTSTISPPVPAPTSPPEEVRVVFQGLFTRGVYISAPFQVTCLSPQCIVLASQVLSSLDTSEDPCENFYDFASEWIRCSLSTCF